MTTFDLNGRTVSVRSPDDAPLLWVIRDELGLTGTKFGCGIGMCGACTVHVEGRATRSCITPVGAVAGANVTTIEGLDPAGQASAANRLDRTAGSSMRLLPIGTDHAGRHAAEGLSQSHRPGHQRGDGRECLSLHDLRADPQGHQAGGGENARRHRPWIDCLLTDSGPLPTVAPRLPDRDDGGRRHAGIRPIQPRRRGIPRLWNPGIPPSGTQGQQRQRTVRTDHLVSASIPAAR